MLCNYKKNQSTEIALIIYRIAIIVLEVMTSNLFATGEYLAQMNINWEYICKHLTIVFASLGWKHWKYKDKKKFSFLLLSGQNVHRKLYQDEII